MSERDIEIVRAMQAAYETGDYERALSAVDPDVVYEFDLGTYRGHEGLRKVYGEWIAAWDDYRNELQEVIDAGDRIVTVVRNRGRSRKTGIELDEELVILYTLRDGKVVHMKTYRNRAEALRDAGLPFTRLSRPAVMGVVNVTPDSFSDGGAFLEPAAGVAHAERLAMEGADIVDIGGESTRPGADPVDVEEELRRVMPVIERLAADTAIPLSIDTSKAPVARAATAAGAMLVNDVTALRADPGMAAVVAETGADLCLVHMLGEPRTMQHDPSYVDVVSDVKAFLEERMGFAIAQDIPAERIWLDPGIGFGKTLEHNLELLRRLDEIVALGRPVVVGVSRKRFIGTLTGRAEADRTAGSVAANVLAYERGAHMFRVHDVSETLDALKVAAATVGGAADRDGG